MSQFCMFFTFFTCKSNSLASLAHEESFGATKFWNKVLATWINDVTKMNKIIWNYAKIFLQGSFLGHPSIPFCRDVRGFQGPFLGNLSMPYCRDVSGFQGPFLGNPSIIYCRDVRGFQGALIWACMVLRRAINISSVRIERSRIRVAKRAM